MRKLSVLLCVFIISACSLTPPLPPGVKGEYRPINQSPDLTPIFLRPRIFDFRFKGEPEEALQALIKLQPQMIILPPTGTKNKKLVYSLDVDLRQVSFENAVKKMNLMRRGKFEFIHNYDAMQDRDFIFVHYED